MDQFDVIIIGAGAAGMFCAIEAGRRGRRVLLLDHAKRAGEKIRISGGGRCNFTNLNIAPEAFLSDNPRFALSALARFTQWDFIDRVARAGIPYHEKTLGQLFCDNSAKDILAWLGREMTDAGVDLRLGVTVADVTHSGAFEVKTSEGGFRADRLVIATGGKSIPKIGATGFGYKIAEQFGLRLTETRPALVPLTFAQQDLEPIKAMAGVSVPATVSANGTSFDEGLLFTHRGLSGPSILQISSYWCEGDEVSVNLLPGTDIAPALAEQKQLSGRMTPATALSEFLPKKLAHFVADGFGGQGTLADQSNAALAELSEQVHHWRIKPVGSEGYRTAEVTLGGVDTRDLDAKTMAARDVPDLFFIGEVVDVTGWLGGYNFQWAWSSGWAAGQVV